LALIVSVKVQCGLKTAGEGARSLFRWCDNDCKCPVTARNRFPNRVRSAVRKKRKGKEGGQKIGVAETSEREARGGRGAVPRDMRESGARPWGAARGGAGRERRANAR
jgi:hypothetical protein